MRRLRLENIEYWTEGGHHALFRCHLHARPFLLLCPKDTLACSISKSSYLGDIETTLVLECWWLDGDAEVDDSYLARVVAPLLQDSTCVDIPRILQLSVPQCQLLHRLAVTSGRIPVARKSDWEATQRDSMSCPLAWLMEDYCRPSMTTIANHVDLYAIEIKPKAGYLAVSPLVHPTHDIKYRKCRFCLLQDLHQRGLVRKKWTSETYQQVIKSRYCPLTFFDLGRRGEAIRALQATPQNNWRVWKNGIKESLNKNALLLLTRVLVHPKVTKLLDRILAIQKLDLLDADGAVLVYERLDGLLGGDTWRVHEVLDIVGPLATMEGAMQESLLEACPFELPHDPKRIHRYCRLFQQCQQVLKENSDNFSEQQEQVRTIREQALNLIENDMTIEDCRYLLQTWLLSLAACDVSLMIQMHVARPMTLLSFEIKVLDFDQKPATKLQSRKAREEVFGAFRKLDDDTQYACDLSH